MYQNDSEMYSRTQEELTNKLSVVYPPCQINTNIEVCADQASVSNTRLHSSVVIWKQVLLRRPVFVPVFDEQEA